ncbi:hypothetical protein D9M68_671630 [compost metagenome]
MRSHATQRSFPSSRHHSLWLRRSHRIPTVNGEGRSTSLKVMKIERAPKITAYSVTPINQSAISVPMIVWGMSTWNSNATSGAAISRPNQTA